jgi:hypothetical protein
VAAAHVRDVIVGTAQQAAKAEMVQGGWKYESINLGWTKGWETERFAERVMVCVLFLPFFLQFNIACSGSSRNGD